jgi:large subunit ribosomal protein L10
VDRAQKEETVAALKDIFSDSNSIVVTQFSGLSATEVGDLRAKMRDAGATFRVTKNRLARLALQDTSRTVIEDLFKGPTGIAFSDDPVAAAKATVEFGKKNDKLTVLGGVMGETVLDVAGIGALAKLPSLDELRGKLVGMISTPATRIAAVTAAPAGKLARVFGAYGSKDEGEAA